MAASLSLLVIRTKKLKAVKQFYETLGLVLREEKHDKGPVHYSATLGDTIFEIYPLVAGEPDRTMRLGFIVDNLFEVLPRVVSLGGQVVRSSGTSQICSCAVIKDPDGRQIELHQRK